MNHFCESPYSSVILAVIFCLRIDNQSNENWLILGECPVQKNFSFRNPDAPIFHKEKNNLSQNTLYLA